MRSTSHPGVGWGGWEDGLICDENLCMRMRAEGSRVWDVSWATIFSAGLVMFSDFSEVEVAVSSVR
jgi:hypothetical protein